MGLTRFIDMEGAIHKHLYLVSLCVVMAACSSTATNKYQILNPSSSANGEFISFSLRCDSAGDGWLVIFGKEHGRLSYYKMGDAEVISNAKFLSEDNKILFSKHRRESSCADICILDLTDNHSECITNDGYGGWDPSFSEDRQTIIFRTPCKDGYATENERITKDLPPQSNIYSIDADGRNRRALIKFDDYKLYDISISSTGKEMLMFRANYGLEESLWIYSFGSGLMRPFRPDITTFLKDAAIKEYDIYSNFYHPEFSPTDPVLSFVWAGYAQGYFGHEIYISDIETRQTAKITDMRASIKSTAFMPDGREIVFVARSNNWPYGDDLWLISTEGGEATKLIDGHKICSQTDGARITEL